MAVERDQLSSNLSKAKHGYDALYLDITKEVLQNMIAESVKRGNKEEVRQLDRVLGRVVVEREKHDK
tara:strand:+ start:154 stop:354 length:201 start_codon:yes stop_codon:yes gene_type:complete